MAAAAIGRHSEPWATFFQERKQEGKSYTRCIEACKTHIGSYEIPPHQTRYQGRQSTSYPRPPAKRIRLCSATLIVVPNNLVDHWEHQIEKHTTGLRVKVLRRSSDKTPSVEELLQLDIILFAKTRFEAESGEQKDNRRDGFVQVDSPLTRVHLLRVIVDEGHTVAGQGTRMTHMFGQLHFERRWVVSGTPADGLYGVEVSLASQEAIDSDSESPEEVVSGILQGRKKTGTVDETEMKALDRLRRIVIEFLDLKPWSNPQEVDRADWTTYIKPIGADGRRRKTPAIRATLQGLMVRHQYETVEREVELPSLYNHVKYLEPQFHDRLSINLFLFGLAVNAITSERQGTDYMFHPTNRKHLNQTINNLRQAGFWWAGSNEEDVQKAIDVAHKYLDKNRAKMTEVDIDQITRGIDVAHRALNCNTWREFKNLHELGILIKDFPDDHREQWALDPSRPQDPLLLGITQACKVQQHVTKNLRLPDPTTGLSGVGIKFRGELRENAQVSSGRSAPDSTSSSSAGQLSHSTKPPSKKPPKRTFKRNIFRSLDADSPLMKAMLVGTASAKLTYLLDRVSELQKEEKIIIFYDNINSAYWISEGLELLGIEFRIYASSLKPEQRTEYLEIFRESDHVRVLLMDLRQASHGLHLAQASRVFIINPIWQPNVESQAIKRAHRIGQTRPVYVETLVLRGTLEDRMLRRRKEMSEAEIQHAEKSLLDDHTMSDIIQSEPFLELGDEDETSVAWLNHPTTFFDRHRLPIPDDEEVGLRTPAKRAHFPASHPDGPDVADSDAAPDASPMPKRPRIGFAADVQVLGEGPSREKGPLPRASPSPAISLFDGDDQSERRRSIFGP
ncbi:hypothetical protein N7492_005006 [Penicillium capsulatum]|uniref:Helicase C-terminal domain-containing protein n=1 Tax=Penicillium capsulatum TaxID=69766 RepID=A0A9W9IB60_9EURO|nr:hypothetical protein N7492_005006 [Penicillium capsulatum]KAJ6135887.1 hypothetical protein N7512_001047 [Penicillium capsulatum]